MCPPPDWLNHRVPIPASFAHLKLLRPGGIDLVLTKMMRGADPEDLSDIQFILKHEPVTEAELNSAFLQVRVPEIQELHDAFRAAVPKVLALARSGAPPHQG